MTEFPNNMFYKEIRKHQLSKKFVDALKRKVNERKITNPVQYNEYKKNYNKLIKSMKESNKELKSFLEKNHQNLIISRQIKQILKKNEIEMARFNEIYKYQKFKNKQRTFQINLKNKLLLNS